MGDAAIGIITAGTTIMSTSGQNKEFVAAYNELSIAIPNFSLGGYDGMHAIYAALEKTKGKTDGEAWSRPPRA